jgi:hypothetical protein
MTRTALLLLFAFSCLLLPSSEVFPFTREVMPADGTSLRETLSQDCLLLNYNTCSGWMWVFSDDPGGVWGTVLSPNDCEGGCANGGIVTDIWFWSHCEPAAPATINGVGISIVDVLGCPTALLWESGPLTVYTCVDDDRWTHVDVPPAETELGGQDFAVTLEWGETESIFHLGSDNGLSNLYCLWGHMGAFPGCMEAQYTCVGWDWTIPGQVSYAYITDIDGDTILDDLCDQTGMPYPISYPYVAPYGYLPNNLAIIVGLYCYGPGAVEQTSWGYVKALYE